MFSGKAVARSHFLRMDDKVAGLVANVKKWRDAEKVTAEKAKKSKERAIKHEEAENELAFT